MPNILRSVIILVIILSFAAGCGERMTKEQMFALAEKHETQDNYESAMKTYSKIVKKFPDSEMADQAQYKIAYIYSNNLNDFEKSVESHKLLLEKYPESKYAVQSLFMIGFIYANNIQDLEKAKEYYKKFLETYPENELVSSVQWELDHLGQDINEIEFLNKEDDTQKEGVAK
ncbi:MAG: tetratricopeptide repeat protein [candidate division KSB1 bacterium]|jgi:TolA-binding protein|nr:tetratricopeptide repeat protein [candidate division KSB1 bacterium]